jgi:hypothetical protein
MRRVLSLLAVLPWLAGPAFGWGCEGHQMIALIARAHLTPAASAAVDRLLRENPVDPALSRFCKDRPNDLMADAATWADDVRNTEKNGDAHYIDIPLAVSSGDAMKWCGLNCIVAATERYLAVLRDSSRAPAERAKALRYVIHFLGDLSQPLHDSDNHDQGGNCTRIRFFAEDRPQNLHAIWDYGLIAHDLAEKKETQPQYAAMIDRDFAKTDGSPKSDGSSTTDLEAWVWEGHMLAATVAYADLKPSIPVASPGAGLADKAACDAERESVEAMHIFIGREYAAQALPVIREQLARAGYRLSGVLNQTFR